MNMSDHINTVDLVLIMLIIYILIRRIMRNGFYTFVFIIIFYILLRLMLIKKEYDKFQKYKSIWRVEVIIPIWIIIFIYLLIKKLNPPIK